VKAWTNGELAQKENSRAGKRYHGRRKEKPKAKA
jgi:hypothetical protein